MAGSAVAIIRGSAIRHNLNQLKVASPGCQVMAVVKANAYGHGLEQVAALLKQADAFAVARVAEGIRLREMGIDPAVKIVVLEGCADGVEMDLAIKHQLDVVVHDPAQFVLLETASADQSINVWLKLDTGMGRLGFRPEEFQSCRERLAAIPIVSDEAAVITHFACADDPDSSVTLEQVRRFGQAIGSWDGDVSLANSAAIFVWPQSCEASLTLAYSGNNWVRPGLALYGASPVLGRSARDLGLEPAMSFESRLIAVKTIAKGSCVGYGGDWRAPRDTIVGVVAAGYGDGYPRHLRSGTPLLVNDRRVPLIGRVSMDMVSVDLTDVPVASVGDRVVLWGKSLPIEEIATRAESIPYELMCGLSQRVEFRYID